MTLTLSIPNTTLATSPGKPHTLYNIHRLPHPPLPTNLPHRPLPPLSPPPKAFFSRTISNPTLTENRRLALESYLHAILKSPDSRWRDSPPWRTFLNLPSSYSGSNSAASSTTNLPWGGTTGPITDPSAWLDSHREVKTLLHDARMYLAKRDQAVTAGEQHEASAGAKRCLVKSSSIIAALEKGLKAMAPSNGWGGAGKEGGELLDGEVRRRKDLLAAARKERDGLESLANSMAAKRGAPSSSAAATAAERSNLFSQGNGKPRVGGGRVLGAPLPETDKTRELDNQGVLLLNDEYMREQDKVVEGLLGNVTRMKDIGVAIGEEIEEQNHMLARMDADVDKVDKKMRIAKKRVNNIS